MPRRPPSPLAFGPAAMATDDLLSVQMMAVKTTVHVQTKLDHHQLLGAAQTILHACSKSPVLTSQSPMVGW